MKSDEFLGHVQNRAKLASMGEALRSVRAVFQTLGERLDAGEAKDLGAQLPGELAAFFDTAEHRKRMSLDQFFQTVASRQHLDLPDAVYRVRVVMEVLEEAVSPGEINDVLAELPPDWAPLFQGTSGPLRMPAGPC